MTDARELLEPVEALAAEAGRCILEIYAGDFGVQTKADHSPLTAADKASHRLIVDRLRELTPQLPILSEEGTIPPFEQRRQWRRYWLIDPLDGTREFVKRNGEFTVNIALVENGVPVLGVVHAPVRAATWSGLRGQGARKLSADGTVTIHTRKPASPLVVVASRSHYSEETDKLLERLPDTTTTAIGSSLKFCLVAEGSADLYPRFGPTSEWDTAAAHCVVEAAGGSVLRFDLRPLRYNTKESLLNPDFLVIGDPAHDWEQYLDGLHGEDR